MSHSQFHCTTRVHLDMHGLSFETSICYWQDQPGSRHPRRARARPPGPPARPANPHRHGPFAGSDPRERRTADATVAAWQRRHRRRLRPRTRRLGGTGGAGCRDRRTPSTGPGGPGSLPRRRGQGDTGPAARLFPFAFGRYRGSDAARNRRGLTLPRRRPAADRGRSATRGRRRPAPSKPLPRELRTC